jgi:CubicO group peptidase (beta-lactamase class C family)
MDRRWLARVSVGISAALLASCSEPDPNLWENMAAREQAANAVFPAANWSEAQPREVGFDSAALDRVAESADPSTSCLVVIRHGEIVYENYWNGFTPESTAPVFSVTQSYTSTLVGIAQDEGLLDIDDSVAEYIPEWAGTPSEEVTIRDILSHVSGRRSTNSLGDRNLYNAMLGSPDPSRFAIGLTQDHPPGEVWSQNLTALELLNPILQAATGMDPAAYAQEKLFAPIGATNTRFKQNANNYTWVHNFVETSCRDAARFGYLFLRRGEWDGTQVVSEDWVQEATSPSQNLNEGFGFIWWLNRPGSLVSIDNVVTPDYNEPSDQKLVPDAPETMYWGLGLSGQLVQVDPATDTVVVRLGAPTEEGAEATAMDLVTSVVTEGLEEE